MSGIGFLFLGMVIAAVIDQYVVEPTDRHPTQVIMWVLTGLALFPFSPDAGVGYLAAITASVFGNAIGDWLDMHGQE